MSQNIANNLKNNLFLGFVQATLLLVHYFNVVSTEKHQLLSRWTMIDLVSLSLHHILLTLVFAWLFSFIKNQNFRQFMALAYLLAYVFYSFGIPLVFFILTGIIIYKSLYASKVGHATKNGDKQSLSHKFLSTTFVICLVHSAFSYYSIGNAKDFNVVESYESPYQLAPIEKSKAKAKNIFYIVFDQLSYQELYLTKDNSEEIENRGSNPKINQRFANFRELANESWNFHGAYSPYNQTIRSIPIMLGFDQKNNLIETINDYGYRSNIIGSYLNYCDVISEANYCSSYSWYKTSSNLDPFTTSFLRHFTYLTTAILNAPMYFPRYMSFYSYAMNQRAKRIQPEIENEFFDLLKADLSKSFIYLHLTVPHWPYIFTKDGVIENSEMIKRLALDSDTGMQRSLYIKNIDYADQVLKRFTQKLKKLKLYDDSLIIVTADHSYKGDPTFSDLKVDPNSLKYLKAKQAQNQENFDGAVFAELLRDTHVPLIIKAPQQRQSKDSNTIISNSRLFSHDQDFLFDQNLELNSFRIRKIKNNLARDPKSKVEFADERIKGIDKLVKDNLRHAH